MDLWTRLVRALDGLDAGALASPAGGRLGGVLVLLGERDGDVEIVYTRRRDDLATHPGQVSFPGGRVEPGESVEEAAVREAAEEVALDPSSVTLLGRLPAFYIPPSRYWVSPVVARWDRPHRLVPSESEVAEIVAARLSTLTDERTWRAVRLSPSRASWAWQLDDRHLLWGATALVTAVLLDAVVPGWQGGTEPAQLGAAREVAPWEDLPPAGGPRRQPLLPGTAERPVRAVASLRAGASEHDRPAGVGLARTAPPVAGRLEQAGTVLARAVARLLGEQPARVLVLAGGGGTGAAGLRAADLLVAEGVDVRVVVPRPPLRPPASEAAARVGERVRVFDGTLPPAELVLDALVGTGLSGPLGREEHAIVLALRLLDAPVMSVDLPSGLHPVAGLVGDSVAADVTIALGTAQRGLLHPALAGFVGDLYVAPLDDAPAGPLVRLVAAAAADG